MSRSKTRDLDWDEVGGFGVLPVDRRRARKVKAAVAAHDAEIGWFPKPEAQAEMEVDHD